MNILIIDLDLLRKLDDQSLNKELEQLCIKLANALINGKYISGLIKFKSDSIFPKESE